MKYGFKQNLREEIGRAKASRLRIEAFVVRMEAISPRESIEIEYGGRCGVGGKPQGRANRADVLASDND